MTSVLEAARRYTLRGYRVVPVPPGQKGPRIRGWQDLRLDLGDLDQHFEKPANIGLLLGEPSGFLVDVDLDCPEAMEIADMHLPPTAAITGRTGAPRSHRWYITQGAVTRRFSDPCDRDTIVEMRSTGCQTLVGPSIHPDGEVYDLLDGDPARVSAEVLATCVAELAASVVARRHPERRGVAKRGATSAATVAFGEREAVERRAVAYLAAMPPAVSGQGGHNATFAAASVLVHGFALDVEAALRLLRDQYNPRCEPPWSERELRHKVEDAFKKPHDRPRGWLLVPSPKSDPAAPSAMGDADRDDRRPTAGGEEPVPLGERHPTTRQLVLSTKRTMPTAQAYRREFRAHPEGSTLVSYGQVLLEWKGNHWTPVEDDALRHELQPWLHDATQLVYDRQADAYEYAPFPCNPATIEAALRSVRALVHLPTTVISPSWLSPKAGRPEPRNLLPCATVNLDIETGALIPATPALFNTNALAFDFDPEAEAPERWIRFLEQLWGEDLESVRLLQEWCGLCLVGDTSFQKMLLIVGPRRSGKGTIARILAQLVGSGNVVGPTTGSLAGTFGLQQLIGKSLAIVSDARFRGDSVSEVVERLLCISGEDSLSINRKYLGAVTMRLPTRFMFLSNELPRLSDASTALAGRFLVLRLTRSFFGHEDPQLTDRLLGELPGILLWAIEGLRALRRRGHFVQPTTSAQAIQDLEDLGSPVHAFVRDSCIVRAGLRMPIADLYQAWRRWCEEDGRTSPGTRQSFGRDLGAAFPGIARRRGTGQIPFYEGIALLLPTSNT